MTTVPNGLPGGLLAGLVAAVAARLAGGDGAVRLAGDGRKCPAAVSRPNAMSDRSRPRRRRARSWSPRVPSTARRLRSVGRGLLGGFVATVVMTAYRLPVFRALPPTAEFWARYVGGGEAEQYALQGLALHLGYGAAAGGVYGLLESVLDWRDPASRERAGLVAGLAYGLVLSVIGSRLIFVRVLGRELQSEHALVFHVGHAIYGATLGTFVASREAVGEVYEESERTRPPTETQRAGR